MSAPESESPRAAEGAAAAAAAAAEGADAAAAEGVAESDDYTHSDFYAFLNLPRSATVEQIQARFRKLSRVFHPDRHAVGGAELQAAAEARSKHLNHVVEVLTDPIRRHLYDSMGEDGLKQVEQASKFTSAKEAEQHVRYQEALDTEREVLSRSNMQGVCVLHVSAEDFFAPALPEFYRHPELGKISLHQSVQIPYGTRTFVTLGGYAGLQNGLGAGGCSIAVKHTLGNATTVEGGGTLGLNAAEHSVFVSAMRQLDENMSGRVKLQLTPMGPDLGLLLQRKLWADAAASVQWQLGLRSGVTVSLGKSFGRTTLSGDVKVGVHEISAHGTAEYQLSARSVARASLKVGLPMGVVAEVACSRHFGVFSKVDVGVGVGFGGVSTTVRFQRAGQTFALPIQLTAEPDLRVAVVAIAGPIALLSGLYYLFVRPLERRRRREKLVRKRREHREHTLAERARALHDIMLQEHFYQRQLASERSSNGLVILEARFGNLRATAEEKNDPEFPCVIEVTKAIQVLVEDGELELQSGSKARIPGIYDPCAWFSNKELYIRYKLRGREEEVTIADDEPLIISSRHRRPAA